MAPKEPKAKRVMTQDQLDKLAAARVRALEVKRAMKEQDDEKTVEHFDNKINRIKAKRAPPAKKEEAAPPPEEEQGAAEDVNTINEKEKESENENLNENLNIPQAPPEAPKEPPPKEDKPKEPWLYRF